MRRAIARGRVFPQYFSTDRRYGRLSLKACALFPLMWVNADDQGRLPGEPEEIKYAACPNIDHITKADIPELLKELDENQLIKLYNTSKTRAIQMLDWWDVQRLQWAWPSQYPPMEGWVDHLRYKKDAKTVITLNWPVSGESQNDTQVITQVGYQVSAQVSNYNASGEDVEVTPLTTPVENEEERRRGIRRGRGRGNSPERSPEEPLSPSHSGEDAPSPSPTVSQIKILETLTEAFRIQWGRVPADSPYEVIPREPDARELAQLRDLAQELTNAGGVHLGYINQAFREAAGATKFFISYVRAILLDWMGLPRSPP